MVAAVCCVLLVVLGALIQYTKGQSFVQMGLHRGLGKLTRASVFHDVPLKHKSSFKLVKTIQNLQPVVAFYFTNICHVCISCENYQAT